MAQIDVIVPVYQAEAFLSDCIESLLSQTFTDWGLILVDDGSRDRSGAICDEYASRDNRIRVIHQPNGGVSAARNRGLSEVAAPWVYFLDSDDLLYSPEALGALIAPLASNPGADAACGVVYLREGEITTPDDPIPPGRYDESGIREQILRPLMGQRLAAPIFNGYPVRYLFRASIIREGGLRFQGGYLEDELFLLEYFSRARAIISTGAPLYIYRMNPASATHHFMRDFPGVFRRFMAAKADFAARSGLGDACPGWVENTNWAGLLIAVGNEFAPGNELPDRQHRKNLRSLCALPEFSSAIAALHPRGCGRRKQIVSELIIRRQYGLLCLLYRLKNRGRS